MTVLTRVEGHGEVLVEVEGTEVVRAEVRIAEPPRLFEALLVGRPGADAVDLTARICGICPLAYQLAASAALEAAAGVTVPAGPVADLRRVLAAAEWIGSHALHVHLLHAPDLLGYEHALAMAADHPEAVERGLRLRDAGQRVVEVLAGRGVHPVGLRVGGFHRAPDAAAVASLLPVVDAALADAVDATRWAASLPRPEATTEGLLVALVDPAGYPMLGSALVTGDAATIPLAERWEHFVEVPVARSTALHSRTADGRVYLTGPLARYSLASHLLAPLAGSLAAECGLGPVCRDPYASIVVRCVETVHALEVARDLLAAYVEPDHGHVEVPLGAGSGVGGVEAPRGVLVHRYRLDGRGRITAADIVAPTAQNQAAIEGDVRRAAERAAVTDPASVQARCEAAVRNHDPCLSCATHAVVRPAALPDHR